MSERKRYDGYRGKEHSPDSTPPNMGTAAQHPSDAAERAWQPDRRGYLYKTVGQYLLERDPNKNYYLVLKRDVSGKWQPVLGTTHADAAERYINSRQTDQHPGGVAGRVLAEQAEIRARIVARMENENLSELHSAYMALAIHDAYIASLMGVFDKLSCDARAILVDDPADGWDEIFGGIGNRIDSGEPPLTEGEKNVWRLAQRYMAQRLGLTLTDDEPGGCYDPHGLEASGE